MTEAIYHLRVLLDYELEVFRDIRISPEDSFEKLHETIMMAFGFSGMEMASFYMSNENWDKGEEITQMDMGSFTGSSMKTMAETEIKEMLTAEGDKMLYVYDFMRMWIFYIELLDVHKKVEGATYPFVSLVVGEAPEESNKEPVDEFPTDFIDDEDFDPEGGFENIDELDDYEG